MTTHLVLTIVFGVEHHQSLLEQYSGTVPKMDAGDGNI